MRTTLRIARRLLLAAAIAGMLVILCASETEGKQNRRIYVTKRADSTITTGYDTATTENAFCAIVDVTEEGEPFVLGALQAQIMEGTRSPLGVNFYCPPAMATIHWHLKDIPNTRPEVPSDRDKMNALCYRPVPGYTKRAPFHLVYWNKKYIVYGVRESMPPDSIAEKICEQH